MIRNRNLDWRQGLSGLECNYIDPAMHGTNMNHPEEFLAVKVTPQSQDPSTFSLKQTLPAPMLETLDGRNTRSIKIYLCLGHFLK